MEEGHLTEEPDIPIKRAIEATHTRFYQQQGKAISCHLLLDDPDPGLMLIPQSAKSGCDHAAMSILWVK